MSYVYFERNNNAVNVEEVKTKEEFESIFGNNIPEAKSLKIRIKELLKLKNTEVTEYSLYKIIELERVSNDTYLYNPKMDIIEELAIVDYLYDATFNPFHNHEDSSRKLIELLNSNKEKTNNKKEKFSFKEVDNEKISKLIKKEHTVFYTFTMSKKDPNKIVIKRVSQEIAKELENLTEGDLPFTKDWLAIPNLSSSTSSESLLKELDKLETYLKGVLVSNPALTIKGEIECIRKYNNHIEELIELSSENKNFRNKLINSLLEN